VTQAEDFFVKLLSKGDRIPIEQQEPVDAVEPIIRQNADDLLSWAASRVREGKVVERLHKDRIVIRVIPPVKVQAMTVWAAPVHVVAVNVGLIVFVYKLTRAIAPHLVTLKPDAPPRPAESETAGRVATLIDWMSSLVAKPRSGDWPVSGSEKLWAANTAMVAERFVLSHELGHVVRGDLILDVAQADPSQLTPEQCDQRPLAQEIEADVAGMFFTIESIVDRGVHPGAGMMGIEMFLQSVLLAEAVGAIRTDDAHQPAAERLSLIRYAIHEKYGEVAAKITQAADELGELMSWLGPLALLERDRRCAASAQEMERIFSDFPFRFPISRDEPAEYALLERVIALLQDTPSVVLTAIDDNLLEPAEFTQLEACASSIDSLVENDRWRRHQIAHFLARNMPLDVRSALGVFGMGTVEWKTPGAES
jgi:hypothetical protein